MVNRDFFQAGQAAHFEGEICPGCLAENCDWHSSAAELGFLADRAF